jgi:hypothetical protein
MSKNYSALTITVNSQPTAGDVWSFGNSTMDAYTDITLTAVDSDASDYEFEIGSNFTTTALNYAQALSDNYSDYITVGVWEATEIRDEVEVVANSSYQFFVKNKIDDDNISFEYAPSYKERIYFTFTSEFGKKKRCVIYDNEYTGDAEEVIASETPFTIEWSDKDVFGEPIKGSGATINFIYTGSESFVREMFTNDIRRFRVVLYDITGSVDPSIEWCGFLNSELFEEDYDYDGEKLGVEYEMTANDGLASLDRYILNDDDYDETMSYFSGTMYCLNKAGSYIGNFYTFENSYTGDYSNMYLCQDLSFDADSYKLVDSNTFASIFYNKSNFYDEDEDYMDMYTMLEEVLKINRYFIIKLGENFYITSVNKKVAGELTYMSYSLITRSYGDDFTTGKIVAVNKNTYYENGSSLSYVSAINYQLIETDTYADEDLFPNVMNDEDNVSDNPIYTISMGSGEYGWNRWSYNGHDEYYIDIDGYEVSQSTIDAWGYQIIKVSPTSDNEEYGNNKICYYTTDLNLHYEQDEFDYIRPVLVSEKIAPKTLLSGAGKLKIDVSALFMDSTAEYPGDSDLNEGICGLSIMARLKVGDKYLKTVSTLVDEEKRYNIYSLIGGNEGYNIYTYSLEWSDEESVFELLFSKDYDEDFSSSTDIKNEWHSLTNYGYYGVFDGDYENGCLITPTLTYKSEPNTPFYIEFGIQNYVSVRFMHTDDDEAVVCAYDIDSETSVYSLLAAMMVTDISIEPYDTDVDTDNIETEWENDDEDWQDEGDTLNLSFGTACMNNAGTHTGNPMVERGAIFFLSDNEDYDEHYLPVSAFTDEDVFYHETNGYDSIEDHIMTSLVANRGEKLVEMSMSLRSDYVSVLDLVEMPDMDGQYLMMTGVEYDVRKGSIEGTWKEIKAD